MRAVAVNERLAIVTAAGASVLMIKIPATDSRPRYFAVMGWLPYSEAVDASVGRLRATVRDAAGAIDDLTERLR